jgi:drug/metabolite transporter (DMT)-like permease
MHNLWFFQALGAAMCWGLGYVLSERLFKAGVAPAFFLLFLYVVSLPFYLWIVGGLSGLQAQWAVLMDNRWGLAWALGASSTFVIGNLLIFMAVMGKNATTANMVEVTFPLFTLLFAWALFREVQIGPAQALGGLLILAGVGLIYWRG